MKNFVFDLYGTLIDIRTYEHSPVFRSAFLREYGSYFEGADFFGEYEKRIATCLEKDSDAEPDVLSIFKGIAADCGHPVGDVRAGRIATAFRTLSRKRCKLYRHVTGMLQELKAAGARVYILSNAQHCFTMDEIIATGLDRLVDGIELSSDFGYKKPCAKFFNHIIEKYLLEREQTMYIGNDISADVCGSKAVGLKPVYIKTAISPADDSLEKAASLGALTAKNHAKLKKLLISNT